MTRRTLALTGPLLVATVAPAGAAQGPPARELSCAYMATFMGVPHVGITLDPPHKPGPKAGPGIIPGCNDVAILPPAPPAPPEPDRVETFFRLPRVAPRFGVTDKSGSVLVVPAASPCFTRARPHQFVRCLWELTDRYNRGPSLVTYPSAVAGATITVGVHVRDPRLRRRVGYGVDAVLLRPEGAGWRPIFRLASPVGAGEPTAAPFGDPFPVPAIGFVAGAPQRLRIPEVEPGRYRLAKRILTGGHGRWLVADLTILPTPVAPAGAGPSGHG